MILPEPPEFVAFLAPYPVPTQELARALRLRLIEQLPPCVETIWDAVNTVGPSYGFTEKNADHFIHLPAYTRYVNIGFTLGALLNDPEGRLQGSGARIRHIKLTRAEDLDDPYVQDLVRQAVESAVKSPEPVEARTIVRVMDGAKRRPKHP
jgi:hypothetical protein